MQGRITKRNVDALKEGEMIADDRLTGFVVRRLPSGRLTYGLRYRHDGKRYWLAIGKANKDAITPEAARKAAVAHAGSLAQDRNPMVEREARRAKARGARSLDEILDGYLKARVAGQRSEREVVSMFNRLVRPKIGRRPIKDLRRIEIVEMLDTVADDNGKRTADKVLSILRSALGWHALRDDSFNSPIVSGMNRLSLKDLTRDRVLNDGEIRSLWSALDGFQPQAFARLVKALLLTACRRGELGDLVGTEIDGDSIVLPAERVKAKVPHTIPITPALSALLGEGDGYRFAPSAGFSPFSDFTRSKQKLDAAIAVQRKRDGLPAMQPWRLHDLRRTARTLMSRAGVPTDLAERVLGHVLVGIRNVYDRHDYAAEKRLALEKLASLVASIVAAPTATSAEIAAADVSGHITSTGASQI